MNAGGYESAPATAMLATHCACCGRALLDATSVEAGIGPECRRKHGYGEAQGEPDWTLAFEVLGPEHGLLFGADGRLGDATPLGAAWCVDARRAANLLVHFFACSSDADERVRLMCGIAALGYRTLAFKLAEHAAGKVEITARADGRVSVKTPFRADFVEALKAARIGARWDRDAKVWTVPTDRRAKLGLWQVLRGAFPGALLVSERGTSTIPPVETRAAA